MTASSSRSPAPPPPRPIRVLIADDHAIVRRGLKEILAETDDIAAAAEASTGREALQAARGDGFEVVLLDIALPDMNGLEVLKQLRALRPSLRVLMLSVYPEEQYALRSLRSGAAGYLTKDSAPDELVEAVRRVSRGGRYVSRALAEQLAAALGEERTPEPHHALSDREFEVLRRLGAGRTVGEVAAELSLSAKTVSTYRARLLNKLGLRTTADIVRYAIEQGLAEL